MSAEVHELMDWKKLERKIASMTFEQAITRFGVLDEWLDDNPTPKVGPKDVGSPSTGIPRSDNLLERQALAIHISRLLVRRTLTDQG